MRPYGFVLDKNASRRTKQRWRAHQNGACSNSNQCRFCRRGAIPDSFNQMEKAFIDALPALSQLATRLKANQRKAQEEQMTDTRPTLKRPLATANSVLAETVANEYHRAAKKVARKKATVEIHQAAYTAGMMVYHRFAHHPCILLAETDPGIWRIELKDGSTENEVPVAILTPVKPPLLTRAGISVKTGLATFFTFVAGLFNTALFKTVEADGGETRIGGTYGGSLGGSISFTAGKPASKKKVRKLSILLLFVILPLVAATVALMYPVWP
jgi:hypothetical protein